jgi:hypothetical protein
MNLTEVTKDAMIYNRLRSSSGEFLEYLKGQMTAPYMSGIFDFIKDDRLLLNFRYLGRRFEIRCEIPANKLGTGEMIIATYMELEEKIKDDVFVFAVSVDKRGDVEERFDKETFSDYYINQFVIQVKEELKKREKNSVLRNITPH